MADEPLRYAALTCTGARPRAFELCERYLIRQTRLPVAWVVVDDCDPATEIGLSADWITVVRPEPRWKPSMNHTMPRNFIAGLEVIKELDVDAVVVFEDDDWYSPEFAERITWVLQRRARHGTVLVGEMNTIYYNVVRRQWRQNWHNAHASLCSCCFSAEVIPNVIDMVKGHQLPNIDHLLFQIFKGHWHLLDSNLVVGIKGIPGGRVGGAGHQIAYSRFDHTDRRLHTLRAWIGEDADLYERFYQPRPGDVPALDPRGEEAPRRREQRGANKRPGKAAQIMHQTGQRRQKLRQAALARKRGH